MSRVVPIPEPSAPSGRPAVASGEVVVRTAGRLISEVYFLRLAVLLLVGVQGVLTWVNWRVHTDREPGVVVRSPDGTFATLQVEWRTSALPREAADVVGVGRTLGVNLLDDTSDSFDHQLELVAGLLAEDVYRGIVEDWKRQLPAGSGGRRLTVYEAKKAARRTCRVTLAPGQARAFYRIQDGRPDRYRFEGLFLQTCQALLEGGRMSDPHVRTVLGVLELVPVRRTLDNPWGLVAGSVVFREADPRTDLAAMEIPPGWTPMVGLVSPKTPARD